MDKNNKLEQALEQDDYVRAGNYIRESTNLLKTYYDNLELEKLEETIEKEKAKYSMLVKRLIVKRSIHFLFGRYIGFIDALYEQLAKKFKEKLFRESLVSCNISDIPHVNDILATIRKEEGIRHGKLAEKVGIEKSTLSGIMDKLVENNAVRFSRPGKYKYYYLSEFGNEYYEQNRSIIEAGTDLDALTEQLLLVLSKEEDANGKVLQIIKCLSEGANVFKGYKSKTQHSVEPSIVFAGIPAIQDVNVLYPDSTIHNVNDAVVLKLIQDKPIVALMERNDNEFEDIFEFSVENLANI